MRLLIALVAFVCGVFGQMETADAAPIGMCGELAESIAAPPPMFPADGAVLRGCESQADDAYRVSSDGAPTERFAQTENTQKIYGVFHEASEVMRAPGAQQPIEATRICLSDEHRMRGLRPPCV